MNIELILQDDRVSKIAKNKITTKEGREYEFNQLFINTRKQIEPMVNEMNMRDDNVIGLDEYALGFRNFRHWKE